MNIIHELYLTTDDGRRLQILDSVERFEWNKIVNGIGRCSLTFPESVGTVLFDCDHKIEIWREPEDGVKRRENLYFIRRVITETDSSNITRIIVYGVDPNELLRRRIIAYVSGSAQATKTDFIDDMMKAIVRENLGALAPAARDWSGAGFSVGGDVSLGPSITKSFAWRNVFTVLQELSEIARTLGTEVYFSIIPTSVMTYQFQTFIGQLGTDRTYPDGLNSITFGLSYGNLSDPILEDDFEDEENYIYGAGQGEGAGRNIQTTQDNARINRSIWNRREAFQDARQESTNAGVVASAEKKLAEGRPKRRFSALLLDVADARYGIDWDLGDRVSATYQDRQYNALIRAVSLSVDRDGLESIDVKLEVGDVP